MKYDTRQIRNSARQVERIAKSVENDVERKLETLKSQIGDGFEGRAAEAFAAEASRVMGVSAKLVQNLSSISNQLYRYAAKIDEADRKTAAVIKR